MDTDNKTQDEQGGNTQVSSSLIRYFAERMKLSSSAYLKALSLSGHSRQQNDWASFLNLCLLYLGSTLVIIGVMSFFAYNWADMHKFTKLGLLETGVIAMVFLTYRNGLDTNAGKVSLLTASVFTGILFATYGQIYQTGADPYSLFFAWAILITGWAVISRQAGIWMLIILLINLSFILYWTQIINPQQWTRVNQIKLGPLAGVLSILNDAPLAAVMVILNLSVLAAWEFGVKKNISWMKSRILPRVVAVYMLYLIVMVMLTIIFDSYSYNYRYDKESMSVSFLRASPLLYVLLLGGSIYYYQNKCRDLFILSMIAISIIVITTAFISNHLHWSSGSFLLSGLVIIAQTGGMAMYLRYVMRSWRKTA